MNGLRYFLAFSAVCAFNIGWSSNANLASTAPAPTQAASPATAPATAPAATAPATAPATKPANKPKVKMSREYWSEAEGGKLKYEYEMRPNAQGKHMRNGRSRAFYTDGTMERTGDYKDDKRVGKWKFYKPDGTFDHESDYGGVAPATPATPPTSPPASRPAATTRPSAPKTQ